ncbi:unnamed protein product [Callosobruchus maculatus]|uniref:BRO1 domain-containing protein n=1 Tax=Callosobruchus maculatus TaxID=64391 RepID=A0A653CNB2_CALMS|nr:unnamed protein product [Callosobruchus maculatus]
MKELVCFGAVVLHHGPDAEQRDEPRRQEDGTEDQIDDQRDQHEGTHRLHVPDAHDFKDALTPTPISEWLFGPDLDSPINTAKDLATSGDPLKVQKRTADSQPSTSRQGNFTPGENNSCNDIRMELMVIMFNIGALHSYLGANESRSNPDGMRLACTHFQCAAWAFQCVKEKYHQFVDYIAPIEFVHFYQQVCLAQAQECILEKSMLDNRKATIVGKSLLKLIKILYF